MPERARTGEVITGEVLEMDDTILIDCEFVNCVMVFRGGTPCFPGCRWRDTRIVFRDQANRTVELLVNVLGWKPPMPDQKPKGTPPSGYGPN